MGTAFTSCPLHVKEVYFLKIKVCILSVFLSVLLFFSNFSVKANNVTSFPAFPSPVEGKSSTHYIILYNNELQRYELYKPLDVSNIFCEQEAGQPPKIKLRSYGKWYSWTGEMTSWKELSDFTEINQILLYPHMDLLYSSFDIKNEDGSIFFQRAPIKVSFLTQMKKIQMGATMKTVVYLIPLLMALLVSLIAFRKTWAWLLKVLHKA